ncbi:hypothetical protein OQA88_1080 [Cercophora sp. LCS_1]
MQKGVIRRILDSAPNLTHIELSFVGDYNGGLDGGSPAKLADVVPLDRVWSNLKSVDFKEMELERQEITRFLSRHRDSLEWFKLATLRLNRTSWRPLLQELRANLCNVGLKNAYIVGQFHGVSEDGLNAREFWSLGYADHMDNMCSRSTAIQKYIISPEEQPLPLPDGHMFSDDEDEDDENEDYDEDYDDTDEDEDDEAPDGYTEDWRDHYPDTWHEEITLPDDYDETQDQSPQHGEEEEGYQEYDVHDYVSIRDLADWDDKEENAERDAQYYASELGLL